MFLTVRHNTVYSYDHPVVLEPHTIRLTPRGDSYRHLIERTMTIIPEPDGTSLNLDYNGSLCHLVWFKRPACALTVISRIILNLNEVNPFDYIVHPPGCTELPMRYPAGMINQLRPYLLSHPAHEQVKNFALSVMQESKNNVLEFLSLLCRKVREHCAYETRDNGEPHPAPSWLNKMS